LNENSEALKEYITSDMKEFLNVKTMQKDWDELLKKQSQTDITTLWRFINLAVWKKVVLNK
jgi:hypothetical protein